MEVTRKSHYGYVGPVKRPSTLIKVDGKTIARVSESQRRDGYYFAEFSFNGGKTYTWVWSASPDKEECIAAAEKEAVKVAKDLAKGKKMKTEDVKIGGRYLVKVSGKLTTVRIENISKYGGWDGRNLATDRPVRIRSGRKLRREAVSERCGTCAACIALGIEKPTFSKRYREASESEKPTIKVEWTDRVAGMPCERPVEA